MKTKRYTSLLCLAVALGFSTVSLAGDAEVCLDCHEPSEDWEGMTPEEILAEAKNADIKRHADNMEISDEAMLAIIAELLEE